MTIDLEELYVGLDYETWSRTNLPEKGLFNYVTDPEFKALIVSTADKYGKFTYDFVFRCYWQDGIMQEQLDDDREVLDSFEWDLLNGVHANRIIMAHNAPFERAVTRTILPKFPVRRFQDSAVDARMLGVGEKLEVASRQLTDEAKLEVGKELIMLFCVPNEFYPDGPTPELIEKHGHMDKWMEFIHYCEVDAAGSREIRLVAHEIMDPLDPGLIEREAEREWECYRMNQNGWQVDIPLVDKMRQRSWANGIIAQRAFVNETGDQINFNSHQQLKKYLNDRGVQAKSLDKYHLPLVLERVKDRIARGEEMLGEDGRDDYPSITRSIGLLKEAEAMLEAKLEIGGSTLSKLPVILNLSDKDGILRDQYVHAGASQTFRTSGKGVQMQNLAKLVMGKDEDGEDVVIDISTVYNLQHHWSNGDMAGQLRQVFESRHPEGEVIVGDFSSVESRALAWIAGEDWKTQTYMEGKDVYKVLASKFFNISYEEVTKDQRPRGKYSELSCGYQSSASVLQDFMFRLGFSVDIETAVEDVMNWRKANPAIVKFWETMDNLMKDTVRLNESLTVRVANGLSIKTTPFVLKSMAEQHPGSLSVAVQVLLPDGTPFVTRFLHGLYLKLNDDGFNVSLLHYKPAEYYNPDKPLWKATYQHPKKKDPRTNKPLEVFNKVYGGKITGIVVQSFCREMFMDSVHALFDMLDTGGVTNALPCGQFHDEIAVDWQPGLWSHDAVMKILDTAMTYCRVEGFPLVADIKSGHRYIK